MQQAELPHPHKVVVPVEAAPHPQEQERRPELKVAHQAQRMEVEARLAKVDRRRLDRRRAARERTPVVAQRAAARVVIRVEPVHPAQAVGLAADR